MEHLFSIGNVISTMSSSVSQLQPSTEVMEQMVADSAVTSSTDYHVSALSRNSLDEFTFNGSTLGKLPEVNIGQILDTQGQRYAERTAAISRWANKRTSYQDLHAACQDIAESLLVHGVHPGDHVVVLAGNSMEYIQLFLAVGSIGAIFSIINPTFSAEEVLAAVEFLGT